MVIVSKEWMNNEAEEEYQRTKGSIMSVQSMPSMNTQSTVKGDSTGQPVQSQLKPQSPNQIQQQTPAKEPISPTSTLKNESQQQPQNKIENCKTKTSPKILLLCHPNSHSFQPRNIIFDSNQSVKVGRSITRNKISENNAIFDCKVLSRHHALLWYADGKFYIRDTCSSNGTFINNQRLSPTGTQSDPYEINTGDLLQFGVDVTENSRKETHGCIIAIVKLFWPENDDTKSNKSGLNDDCNKVLKASGHLVARNIPSSDLCRLNQYLQEAVQREQVLETKLLSLQKIVELTRKNSSNTWQAMIEEDRLLSRIDILENKLQFLQKNVTDDKLRQEILKLQEDKCVYQNSAKEALRKVNQDRNEAIQKLTTIERALCSSEDECSLLRDQLLQAQQNFQEVTTLLASMEEKRIEISDQLLKSNNREAQLTLEIESAYEQLKVANHDYELERNANRSIKKDLDSLRGINVVKNWFEKSDLKNMNGGESIMKAICGDELETESKQEFFGKVSQKIFTLENLFKKITSEHSQLTSNGKTIPDIDQNSEADPSSTISTTSTVVNSNDLGNLEDFNENSSEQDAENNTPVQTTTTTTVENDAETADTNVNRQPDAVTANNVVNELSVNVMDNDSNNINPTITSIISHLKDIYCEINAHLATVEDFEIGLLSTYRAKLRENEEELQAKTKQCEQLQEQVLRQSFSKTSNAQTDNNKNNSEDSTTSSTSAATSSDDENENDNKRETNEIPSKKEGAVELQQLPCSRCAANVAAAEASKVDANTSAINGICDAIGSEVATVDRSVETRAYTDTSVNTSIESIDVYCQTHRGAEIIGDHNSEIVESDIDNSFKSNLVDNAELMADIKLLSDPDVQREEELIAFKEQCARLKEDNLLMQSKMNELQIKLTNGSRMGQLLMYATPLIAIICYMLFSPYL